MTAPTTPSRMVESQLDGSLCDPGIRALAITPAIKPTTIHAINPIVSSSSSLNVAIHRGVANSRFPFSCSKITVKKLYKEGCGDNLSNALGGGKWHWLLWQC